MDACFPDYMITSNAEIKFSIKNYAFGSLDLMDGCLCFKEKFNVKACTLDYDDSWLTTVI